MKLTINAIVKMQSSSCAYTRQEIEKLIDSRPLTLRTLDTIDIPITDKIWLLLHEEILPARVLRLLACRVEARVLRRLSITDKRYWNAIEVARRFAKGKTTTENLFKAQFKVKFSNRYFDARNVAMFDAGEAAYSIVFNTSWHTAAAAADATTDAAAATVWKRQYEVIKRLVRKHNPKQVNLKAKVCDE